MCIYRYLKYVFSSLINRILRVTCFKPTLCCHSSSQSALRVTDAGLRSLCMEEIPDYRSLFLKKVQQEKKIEVVRREFSKI